MSTELKALADELRNLYENWKTECDDIRSKFDPLQREKLDRMNSRFDELEGAMKHAQLIGKRPALSPDRQKRPYEALFEKSLRRGNLTEAEKLELQARDGEWALRSKAYNIGTATAGAEWAPEEFVAELARDIVEISPVRQIARIHQTSMHSTEWPTHAGDAGVATRPGETGARGAALDATSGLVTIESPELFCRYDATRWMIDDAAFDMVAEIRIDLAEQIALLEGQEFIDGAGTTTLGGIETATAHTTPDTITAALFAGEDSTLADLMIEALHVLTARDRANATWLMNKSTLAVIRKLKSGDATGNAGYIWQPSFAANQPATILGQAFVEFPAVSSHDGVGGSPFLFIGDFRRAYRLVTHVGFTVLVDPFSGAGTGLVAYHGWTRVGGDVVKPQAYNRINSAA